MKKQNLKKEKNNIKKNNILYFIIVLILTTMISTLMHIMLFHTALFNNIDVLFYRGIALLLVVVAIIIIVLWYLKIDLKDLVCIAIVILSFNLTFFTLVPVTIDRSVTVFTLGKFDKANENSLTKEEMEKIFIDEYVYEKGAFDKRYKEQVATGSIEKVEGSDKYVLTTRGKRLINIFSFIGKLYNVDLENLSR